MSEAKSVFAKYEDISYPIQYAATIVVPMLVGGVPFDKKVAEGWIKSKVKDTDDRIRQMIAETMVERKVTLDEATKIVNEMKNLNGFKRLPCPNCDPGADYQCAGGKHELYIEGRQVKAALKEAVSVAVAADKIKLTGWGKTRKFLTNYLPEHVFITEKNLPLGVYEASGVLQQFAHTRHGDSITYQEYVDDAEFSFNVITDHPFTPKDWGMIWTTGQWQGVGASRSQGYGTYSVTRWDKVRDDRVKKDEEEEDGS